MFTRRSGRIGQGGPKGPEQQATEQEKGYFTGNGKTEEEKNTSATQKALDQMDTDEKKKFFKKKAKLPPSLKRKRLNMRLSRLLTPKTALIFLHETMPGCVYKVQELQGCFPPSFVAQVEHNNEVLGTGQGLSKAQAKNVAAENAIKTVISRTMAKKRQVAENGSDAMDQDDPTSELPWVGLASFAIYKMFSEWQSQGTDLPPLVTRPAAKAKAQAKQAASTETTSPAKKELPPNALDLHPAVVLNMLYPGLVATEVEREVDGTKCRVKMGFTIDGILYTGTAGNKKDAKKEAAKSVLQTLYGLNYPA